MSLFFGGSFSKERIIDMKQVECEQWLNSGGGYMGVRCPIFATLCLKIFTVRSFFKKNSYTSQTFVTTEEIENHLEEADCHTEGRGQRSTSRALKLTLPRLEEPL